MLTLRTTARGFLVFALLGLLAGTAAAYPDPPRRQRVVAPKPTAKPAGQQIVYPILGRTQLTKSFGDPRGQGSHQGEDIMADRWTPVLAAEAGRVRFHITSGRAGCMLYLYGKSGAKYLYIHLNNDLTQQNDNRGNCVQGTAFWKGLKDGAKVEAGQPLGFVGDSGDANGVSPHLHFEVHPAGQGAVDPLPYLRTAKRLLFWSPPGKTVELAMTGKVLTAGDQWLRLKVGTLRGTPMGVPLRKLDRLLTLTVPVGTLVERGAGDALAAARLTTAKPGESVTVWTQPTVATADVQAGKRGTLSAERVLLPPS